VRKPFLDWLSFLACLSDHGTDPAIEDYGWRRIRRIALLLLARMHVDAPDAVPMRVSEWSEKAYRSIANGKRYLNLPHDEFDEALLATSYVAGDGMGPRASCAEVLDRLASKAIERDQASEEVQLKILRAIRNALWRHVDFLGAFTSIGQFASWFPAWAEQLFRKIHEQLKRNEASLPWFLVPRFVSVCEILLALLRLRALPERAMFLAPQGTAAGRLAWLVRQTDRELQERLQDRGGIHSAIRFEAHKPPALGKMSELGYALNSYLTGESGTNLIVISSVDSVDADEDVE
jgi:hypothetical protein